MTQFTKGQTGKMRCGYDYEVVATDLSGDRLVAAIVTGENGAKSVRTFSSDGRYFRCEEHDFDLMSPRTSMWANEYANDPKGWFFASPYRLREDADEYAIIGRTAVIELIFENGKLVGFERHEVTS